MLNPLTARTVKLQDVNPDIFDAYVFWVYRKELPPARPSDSIPLVEDLTRLWLLADRLADVRLRNTAIDAMIAEINGWTECVNAFPSKVTTLIWSATTPGRSIRRMVIDYYVKHVDIDDIKEEVVGYHPDFTKDLMLKAVEVVRHNDRNICLRNREPGYYHDSNVRE